MTNKEMRQEIELQIDYGFLSLFIGEDDYGEGMNFGKFIGVLSVAKTLNIISFEEYKKLMNLTKIVSDLNFDLRLENLRKNMEKVMTNGKKRCN